MYPHHLHDGARECERPDHGEEDGCASRIERRNRERGVGRRDGNHDHRVIRPAHPFAHGFGPVAAVITGARRVHRGDADGVHEACPPFGRRPGGDDEEQTEDREYTRRDDVRRRLGGAAWPAGSFPPGSSGLPADRPVTRDEARGVPALAALGEPRECRVPTVDIGGRRVPLAIIASRAAQPGSLIVAVSGPSMKKVAPRSTSSKPAPATRDPKVVPHWGSRPTLAK